MIPPQSCEIQVLRQGRVVHSLTMSSRALLVGRAPDNDLVLADGRVSGHHLVLHWDDSGLVVRDLGSTNGTYLNDVPVTAATPVSNSDVLRLGSGVILRIFLTARATTPEVSRGSLVVVDLGSGLAYAFHGNRFRIGRRLTSDLHLPNGPEVAAALTRHANGELWLGTDEEEHQVQVGEPFEVAGHRLLLRENPPGVNAATEQDSGAPGGQIAPYRLRVNLVGQTGPEALLEDLRTGQRHTLRAENRVVLLYVLAQRVLSDREGAVPTDDRGWLPDDEAMRGIWGRRWESMGSNNFQVLLCRVRKEIHDAGMDGWFLEKRRGYTRIALDDVEIEGG